MTAPPMAYFGGKTRLASRIAAMLPPHEHYVEPFAGSLAVLLAKPPSRMETVNDLDGDLMTFWRVLRERPDELVRACALTPHSRAEYIRSRDRSEDLDELERARQVWTCIVQGRAGTLRRTGWRHYIDPAASKTAMPRYLEAYTERMIIAAERLMNVSLECRPAIDVIRSFDIGPSVCMYVDPPYLNSTRSRGSGWNYQHDMGGDAEHIELLEVLVKCRSSIILSGYPSEVYSEHLAGWDRIEIQSSTGQGERRSARTEVLWCNRSADLTLDFEVRP